jgi:hypothetical protein
MNLGLGGLPQLRRSVCPPFHGEAVNLLLMFLIFWK